MPDSIFRSTWWRHRMETFSALLALCAGNSPVPGEFPAQRPVTRSFDVFFDLCLNKQLSKQSWGWWFETPSRPLRRHRDEEGCANCLTCVRLIEIYILAISLSPACFFNLYMTNLRIWGLFVYWRWGCVNSGGLISGWGRSSLGNATRVEEGSTIDFDGIGWII